MKRALRDVAVVAGIVLVLAMVVGWAEPVEAQTECFRAHPFDDVITMDIVQPASGVSLFILEVDWSEPGALYLLRGGGIGTLTRSGDGASLQITLHNPTTHFGGNPVCRLHALLALPSLTGPWAIDCMRSDFEHPVFTQAGQLIHQSCGAPAFSPRILKPRELAGERSLEE